MTTLHIGWQLLTGKSPVALDMLLRQAIQLADIAEYAGIDALHLPHCPGHPEPLTLAAAISARTRRLQLLVGVSQSWLQPSALVVQVQSLQVLSGNRAQLFLQDDAGQGFTAALNADQRRACNAEYLRLIMTLLEHAPEQSLSFHGEYYQLERAEHILRAVPAPPLWCSAARYDRQAALHVRHCLLGVERPDKLAGLIQEYRQVARGHGRRLYCHVALELIARPSEQEAWTLAAELIEREPGSEGDDAVLALRPEPVRQHEFYPNLLRCPRTGKVLLVGDYAQVAMRLGELQDIGVDGVLLSSSQAVEQCLGFAEQVIPLLARQERAVWKP